MHIDDKRMFDNRQQLPFILNGLHASLGDYAALEHFFHGERSFRLEVNHAPYLPEASLANSVFQFKTGSGQIGLRLRLHLCGEIRLEEAVAHI